MGGIALDLHAAAPAAAAAELATSCMVLLTWRLPCWLLLLLVLS
jgi:hypothetical protein